MKIGNKTISVPPWISTHSYFAFSEKSRSYLTNEKRNEYSQLDGLSSDLWFLMVSNDEKETNAFIRDKGLNEAVDDFIIELFNLGLLVVDGELPKEGAAIVSGDGKETEEADFVVERNDWLWKNGFISSMLFELTYRCNLKCVHCYNPKDQSNNEIDFGLAKRIIDEAYELGCYEVTLTGGESTTYSKFIELCKYIRKKRMALIVFTNGQNLFHNKELYDDLAALYPHQVSISLYSNIDNKHDKVTDVSGSFARSKSVIESLRKDGISVQIKNFLLNFVCKDCVEVQKYADSIGARNVSDISLIPTIQGDKKTLIYELSDDDLFFLYTNPESPFYLAKRNAFFDFEKNKDTSPCLGGFNGLTVTPNGEFKICVSVPSVLCKYSEMSLLDLWKGAINKVVDNPLYKWQRITNGDLSECYKHDYCKFCHYCAGMAMLENGYLKRSNVLCKQAKAKMRAFNYLKENGVDIKQQD